MIRAALSWNKAASTAADAGALDELDLTGLHCPHVVLRLADHMRGLAPGRRLTVTATDPLSAIDVPFYLHRAGHRLLSRWKAEGRILFVIESGGGAAGPD